MTYIGLYELHQKLRENQLCVIFRNNHFATLFKYKNQLFTLITDSGFLHEPIVWEKLNEVDNDTEFCDVEFRNVSDVRNVQADLFAEDDIREQLIIEQKIIEKQQKMDQEYVQL